MSSARIAEEPGPAASACKKFGRFRFFPERQLLLEGETRVRLGSRALEILVALVERPGELISKEELVARVWPNTFVEESNLKVHVAALRRALGDGQSDHRYVATASGRGYRFVAPIEIAEAKPRQRSTPAERTHNLPAPRTRAIGRAETIDAIFRQLPQCRFVTIVGPGGIGKTTVALAAAEALVPEYDHGVWFVDLAPLRDPQRIPSALASALGVTIQAESAVDALLAYLRDRRVLIVLDSCEHLIEAAAMFAEQIIACAPDARVLATSREPLRARGESVHRLPPLEIPPSSPELTAAEALAFPAVELFVERAAAALDGFELSDADAPIVAGICRKLDGVALAIELAASRIDAFGAQGLLTLLDDRLRLLKQGRRTAPPRHRTLAATLDWSYELLSENERAILRRLSVFAGVFSLESASAVVADGGIAGPEVIEGVANLVAKSLVSANIRGAVAQYRLLDITRAYARQKLADNGELGIFVRRHAEYHRDLFGRAEAEWEARPTGEWLADYGRKIDDVRSAVNWAFSPEGDVSIGVALTVAAIPLWMHLSLMEECQTCIERALGSEKAAPHRSGRDEMKLYAGLAAALLHARGPLPQGDIVWSKALRIAESLDDSRYLLRVLWGLSICRFYVGDYRAALDLLGKFRAIASKRGDAADMLSCDRLIATTLHYLGDQARAQRGLERVLAEHAAPLHRSHIARFQYDQRVAAQYTLANTLWLQGLPDQATHLARNAVADARASGHAFTLCSALIQGACPIALYVGDLRAAERLLEMLEDLLAKQAMTVSNALVQVLQGTLLVKRGDRAGIPLLWDALSELREARFRLRYPAHLGTLAQGLCEAGQTEEARAAIDEALDWSGRKEERWCVAELLRIKGNILLSDGSTAGLAAAEDTYRQALEWAYRQKALSWALRAATSLAQLWHQHRRTDEARDLLTSVYSRFTEGFETVDLKTARALIEGFSRDERRSRMAYST